MEHKKLGFGFMRLPVKNIHDQTNIDIEELCKMVDRFIGSGFSYFDLAYIYHNGVCEKTFNQAVVSRYSRDKYLVATKMPLSIVATKHHEQIFSEQLRNCGVDYFDYYLLHGMDYNTIPIVEKLNSFDFIHEKKKAGLIRHIGFSYHDTPEKLDEILTKHPEVDFVQLQMNYLDWESPSIQSRRCCEVTKKYNKQIMVMEPVKGGILANVPEQIAKLFKGYNPDLSAASWAIRFAASQENVVMVLSGMSNTAQIEDNVRYMQNFVPLSETEYSIIQQAISLFKDTIAIPCTSCRYCESGCPKEIAIPEYFSIYNAHREEKKLSSYRGMGNNEYLFFLTYSKRGKPADCIACKQCEKICPQHLPIVDHLKTIGGEFGPAIEFLTSLYSPQKTTTDKQP